MARACSIAEARDQLPALVHEVERGDPVSLTRRGKPVAVLISTEEYERLKAGRKGFWEAFQEFRAEYDVESLDLGDVFDNVRDRSPGRDVDFG